MASKIQGALDAAEMRALYEFAFSDMSALEDYAQKYGASLDSILTKLQYCVETGTSSSTSMSNSDAVAVIRKGPLVLEPDTPPVRELPSASNVAFPGNVPPHLEGLVKDPKLKPTIRWKIVNISDPNIVVASIEHYHGEWTVKREMLGTIESAGKFDKRTLDVVMEVQRALYVGGELKQNAEGEWTNPLLDLCKKYDIMVSEWIV